MSDTTKPYSDLVLKITEFESVVTKAIKDFEKETGYFISVQGIDVITNLTHPDNDVVLRAKAELKINR